MTGLRGAAALWVALQHVTVQYLGQQAGPNPLRNFALKGWLGVDLFFVLSGFVLCYVHAEQMKRWNTRRAVEFLKLRLARVYPAHALTTLLLIPLYGLGVTFLAYRPSHDEFSLPKLFFSLALLNGWGIPDSIGWNNVSWSVSSEWFAYLAFPAIVVCLARIKRVRANVASIVLVFALTFMLAWLINGGRQYMLGQAYTLVRVATEFVTGCLAYNIFRALSPGRSLDAGIWLAVAGIACLCMLRVPDLTDGITIALFVLLVLSLSRPGALGSAAFGNAAAVYLGDISYSMYLVHPMVMVAVMRLVKHLSPTQDMTYLWLIFGAYLAGTIACAHLLWRFVEKPARTYLRSNWIRGEPVPAGEVPLQRLPR